MKKLLILHIKLSRDGYFRGVETSLATKVISSTSLLYLFGYDISSFSEIHVSFISLKKSFDYATFNKKIRIEIGMIYHIQSCIKSKKMQSLTL